VGGAERGRKLLCQQLYNCTLAAGEHFFTGPRAKAVLQNQFCGFRRIKGSPAGDPFNGNN